MDAASRKQLKAIITGTTGMVGRGVLLECLDDHSVSEVLVINRQPLGLQHSKLKEIVHKDFYDLSSIEDKLGGYDCCFFCLGVSAVGMKEADYRRVTYDLTIHFATTLSRLNQGMTFCYVTGQGTDSTGQGKVMWARVKGQTENAVMALPFKDAYMFRPGYIHPMRNIRSRTRLYNAVYLIAKPLYPLFKKLAPDTITTTEAVGKAMIRIAQSGYPKKFIGPKDINEIAAS